MFSTKSSIRDLKSYPPFLLVCLNPSTHHFSNVVNVLNKRKQEYIIKIFNKSFMSSFTIKSRGASSRGPEKNKDDL